jgi:hypothetical protein
MAPRIGPFSLGSALPSWFIPPYFLLHISVPLIQTDTVILSKVDCTFFPPYYTLSYLITGEFLFII